MECNYKPIDWSNYPPIEKRISFGDTNDNKLDIAIDERVVTLDTSKLAASISEKAIKSAALAEQNAKRASNGEKPTAKAI